MKKLIFLLIILPTIVFGQQTTQKATSSEENLKKSAETFVTNWLQSWENKKWDEILSSSNDNGIYYTSAETNTLPVVLKRAVDYYKSSITDSKILINSLSTEVIGQTVAMVTARYLEATTDAGNVTNLEYLDLFFLEMNQGSWKIKTWYSQFFAPVIFNKSLDKKMQKGKVEPVWRYFGTVNQMNSFLVCFLEDYKKKGVSPAQAGKMMGARFAKEWDQSNGFAGLSSGMMWNFQTMSSYIEVLERNENTLKIKMDPFQVDEKNWNVTQQEFLEFYQNSLNEIATHMGGTSTTTADGRNWIITLSKK
jgi:hypothetical protein